MYPADICIMYLHWFDVVTHIYHTTIHIYTIRYTCTRIGSEMYHCPTSISIMVYGIFGFLPL